MNKDTETKIRNIVDRSVLSLSVGQDLPRFSSSIKIFQDARQIFPPESYNPAISRVENIFNLVSILHNFMNIKFDEAVFNQVFERQKNRIVHPKIPEVDTPFISRDDGLDKLQDKRLRETLRFIPVAFQGSESDGTFLFKLDKPTSQIAIIIRQGKVQVREWTTIKPPITPDCTICCSSSLLTTILNGSLEPAIAVRGGHMIVENMQKLMVFVDAFEFDKREFEKWATENNVQVGISAQKTLLHQQEQARLQPQLLKYFGEVLGDDHKVVKLLKTITSVTVVPALTELKFLALGQGLQTKDVENSWVWEIHIQEQGYGVKTRKQEIDLQKRFQYEWALSFQYDLSLSNVQLKLEVISISFDPQIDPVKKEEVTRRLTPYCTPKILSEVGKSGFNASDDSFLPPNSKAQQYANGDHYQGQLNAQGLRHGKGIYTTKNGDVFVGSYVNGKRYGYGVYTMFKGARYEGSFQNGLPNGNGVYYFENGDIYKGSFRDDEFHGYGVWSSKTGSSYEGEFHFGHKEGRGIMFLNGNTYDGTWKNDTYDGSGIFVYQNGDIYEGGFVNGRFQGLGRYLVAESGKTIEGLFHQGVPVDLEVETKKLEGCLSPDDYPRYKEHNKKKIEERKRISRESSNENFN